MLHLIYEMNGVIWDAISLFKNSEKETDTREMILNFQMLLIALDYLFRKRETIKENITIFYDYDVQFLIIR